MNPFVSRLSRQSWEVPVAAMSLVLGVMLSMAWISDTTRSSRAAALDPDQRRRLREGLIDLEEYQKLTVEVRALREENGKLQNAMSSESKQSKVLNESLQQAKLIAGLTEVEGPGITIVLSDSMKENNAFAPEDRIVHDYDVLRLVNELWAAGAEGIEVNGHRVIGSTSFRCVGPVIHVDSVPISPPVKIRAIGDPKTLMGGLNIPLGVLDQMRQMDKDMVKIEEVKKHHFAAYTGPTSKRYLKVPKADSK
ncbi:MAG TPA: DUF881 domain-containing protein [Fimbriimonadaceae bacterium]|nr:DUF881 domain-containing protein [Fimbriimonadaceae bacterium]